MIRFMSARAKSNGDLWHSYNIASTVSNHRKINDDARDILQADTCVYQTFRIQTAFYLLNEENFRIQCYKSNR